MRSIPILAAVLSVVAFSAAEPGERATKGLSLAPEDGVLWLSAPEDVHDHGAAFYTLTVTNGGVDVIPGPIVVELEYSPAFAGASIIPQGWSCVLGATTGTCTWPNDLGPGGVAGLAGFLFTVLPPYGDEVTCDFFRSPCILLRGQIVGYGNSVATSAVTIGQNVPPNAEQDFYFFGPVPAPIDADVLSNDSDVQGDFLFVSIVDPLPAHGTATVDPVTRHILYTPDGTGTDDAVRYRIADSYGGVDTAFAHFGNLPGGIAFDTPLANIGQVEPGRVAALRGTVHNTTGFDLLGTYSLEELDPAEIPGVLASAGYPASSAVVFDPSVFLPRDNEGLLVNTPEAGSPYVVRPHPGTGTVWLARLRLTAFPTGSPQAVRTATTVMAARTALPHEVPVHVRDDAETIPPDQPTMLHPLFNDDSTSGAPLTISSFSIILFDEPTPPGSWGTVDFAEDTNGGPPWTGALVTPNPGFVGTGIFHYAASEIVAGSWSRYDYATVTVTVGALPPPPTATASGSAAICAGASTGLSGSGGVSCSWSPATGLDDASSCTPIASPTSTTTYTLTVIDQHNQASTNNPTVTIQIDPLPTAVAGGSATITLGQSTPLSGSGGASCAWSPGTGLDNAGSCAPMASPASTTTYALVVTSAAGCASINPATATITVVQAVPADLVTGLIAPVQGRAGQPIRILFATLNIGAGDAGASTTRFYLSRNNALDASDVAFATFAVPALVAGDVRVDLLNAVIPPGSNGSYYVIAAADDNHVVFETNEANNTGVSPWRMLVR